MTRRVAVCLTLLCLLFPAAASADVAREANAQSVQLAATPAVSPDGTLLAFSWRGDIWTVATAGGTATRLTTDPGSDTQPDFSPDGTQLAFVSTRTGSPQIFVMPAEGGTPTQVTHHSEGYRLHDWFPDGQSLLASGSRDHHWRGSERLLKVHLDRRTADTVLADATASDASLNRKGTRVLFVREGERWWRKGYRGERAAQVWLLNLTTGEMQELLHEGVDCRWPLWHRNGKAFYFTKGDSSGFDLWRYRFHKGKDADPKQQRLVDFDDDSVVYPAIARDSGLVVFRHLFDFYRYQPGTSEQPEKIDITYAGDPLIDTDLLRRELSKADEITFATDGLEMVFAAGGDLWAMDTVLKEPLRLTDTGSYESSPVLLSATKGNDRPSRLFVVARREGQADVWQATRKASDGYWWQEGDLEWTRLTDDSAVERNLRLSPDGRSLYFVRGLGELVRLPLDAGDGGEAEPITITDGFDSPDYDISPCGAWVAFAQDNDNFNSEIWIRPSDASTPAVNISEHPDNDYGPRFSPDGTLLAFTARRADTETDIHYVYLQADEAERTKRDRSLADALEKMTKARGGAKPQPPKKDDEPKTDDDAKADSKDAEHNDGDTDADAKPDNGDPPTREPIRIDFDSISERLRHLSVPEAGERGLFWIGEKAKLAFHADIDKEPATYTVTFPDELTPKKLTSDRIGEPTWSKAAKGVLGLVDGVPALVEESGKTTRYGFTARQELSQSERLQDAFEVAWQTMRDRWYDERHGGRNWAEVRRKYLGMAAAAGDTATLGSVIELMLGELNGSHNGFYPRSDRDGGSREPWTDQTAHLGVRFVADDAGPGLLVRDVLPGGPADRVESRLLPGDRIEAIDGTAVDPAMDLTEVLNGRLDRDIHLRVVRAAHEDDDADDADKADDDDQEAEDEKSSETLDITLRPISYGRARDLLYDAWLEHNRTLVDEQSDGRFGYLHIKGMNLPSFYEFEEQLYRVGYGKQGLVIDVRDNGGGYTTDMLLTALTQPRHAITVPRGGGPGYPHDRMVYAVWQKPIVVLCNQNSYSNAEIFSHAIKTLGRGQLVGVKTAGGVISTGAVSITDVGTMRMPFRGWFVLGSGEDMEMHGAVPDHIVWPQPGELPQGIDRQLEKAVEVLGRDVDENPPTMPTLRYATQRDPAE